MTSDPKEPKDSSQPQPDVPEDPTFVGPAHQDPLEIKRPDSMTAMRPIDIVEDSPFVPMTPVGYFQDDGAPMTELELQEDDGPTEMVSSKLYESIQSADVDEFGKRYQEFGILARGGMSLIHKALDRTLFRPVALKVLDEKLVDESIHAQRFVHEAQISGQLEHPHIVPVYEFAHNKQEIPFFAMKWVKGKTLKAYIHSREYQIGSARCLYEALQIFMKICDAISFAHNRGVLHLDLKPSNVMLASHGQVYVMDWGIARTYQELPAQKYKAVEEPVRITEDVQEDKNPVLGTWNYMSPEQAKGAIEQFDERTDIFALGAILYEMLTGDPPYLGELYEILSKIQSAEIEPAEERVSDVYIPKGLSKIAQKALSYKPEERYNSVESLKRDIDDFIRGGGDLPVRQFEAGSVLVREGEHGEEAYIIIRGRCRVFKRSENRDVVIRDMGPGDVFGETAVFLERRRTATVKALDEVTVAVVSHDVFEEKMLLGSWMERFVKTLAERFQELDQQKMKQLRENEQLELFHDLLTYLHLYNESDDDFRMQAKWSPLRDMLTKKLECSAIELETLVERLGVFQFEPENDLYYATSSALHFYLKRRGFSL